MNILILNSIGRKKWGGGEKWMILAAKELESLGHNVTVGSFSNSKIHKAAIKAGINFQPFTIHTDFSILGVTQLKIFLKRNRTDVIIACQNRDVRASGFARSLSKPGFPLIVARQGINRIGNSLKYRLTFTKMCDAIITNTLSLKNLYDSYGWWSNDYVRVVHNGLQLKVLGTQKMDLSKWFAINGDNIIVTATTRLAKQKNLETLIDAAAEVLKSKPHYRFIIAGEGKEHAALQSRIEAHGISDYVKLIGFVDDVESLLNSSHIFALSSLFEGMPNSILEAMYMGLPVVSTRVNGVPEIIENGVEGFIYTPRDSKQLAKHLIELDDQELRNKMGKAASEKIESQFSAKNMAINYEKHIKELLNRKK